MNLEVMNQMLADERWLGFGYLGGRNVALDSSDPEAPARPELVAEVDAWVVAQANERGLSYDQLFAWANSVTGRHFADVVFGGDSIEQAQAWGLGPSARVAA